MTRQATANPLQFAEFTPISARPKVASVDPRDEIVEHLQSMRAFARSLTRDHSRADDLVHDTVIKAWTNIGKFKPGTNMHAWLFTILRNTFYSDCRKASREVADHAGALSARMAVLPDHDGKLALAEFRRALETLPNVQREALILIGAEGFTYQATAAMCGCPIGTIKSRVNRARQTLTEILRLEKYDTVGIADHAAIAMVGRNAWS